MGEFYEQEVLREYEAKVHIRLDEARLGECFDYNAFGRWTHVKNAWKSEASGRYTTFSLGQLRRMVKGRDRSHALSNTTAPTPEWSIDSYELKVMADKKIGINYMN